jgi:predicted DNA-binding transcriptional regulator AlpA
MKMINNQIKTESVDQLLRINEVSLLTTLSKSSINLWVAQDRFPKPLNLSKTLKVWRLRDIREWAERMQEASA